MRQIKQRVVAVLLMSGLALAITPTIYGQAEQLRGSAASVKTGTSSVDLAGQFAMPSKKSTVFGGEIRSVDPVRDQLTLRAAGLRPMKILFDERTEIYVDGKRILVRDLHPADHASVQTALDGTDIFAVSIHILSQSPEGDYEGRVLHYNPGTGELTIVAPLSREQFSVHVPQGAPIERAGQPAFTAAQSGPGDLIPGALVSVKFENGSAGQGIAKQISIFAVPGSVFIFSGTISALDVPAGAMTLVDQTDNKSYEVFVDPRLFPDSRNLHVGSEVRVSASYNGVRYEASKLTMQ